MKLKQLEQLENGTLIKISGKGVFGTTYMVVSFNKETMYLNEKGLIWGSTLYPLDWIFLATETDYMNAIKKASDDFNRHLDKLKASYEKARKQK